MNIQPMLQKTFLLRHLFRRSLSFQRTLVPQKNGVCRTLVPQKNGVCRFSTQVDHCWKCNAPTESTNTVAFCPSCGSLSRPPKLIDHFKLFGVEQSFEQDTAHLAKIYKDFQRKVHPDKFSLKSEEEKQISEEWSPIINEAHFVLSRPVPRALYLLELLGQPLEEGQIDVDPDFFMEIMELNEKVAKLDNTKDVAKVKELGGSIREIIRKYEADIKHSFDNDNVGEARTVLAHMKYYDNVLQKIVKLETELGMFD